MVIGSIVSNDPTGVGVEVVEEERMEGNRPGGIGVGVAECIEGGVGIGGISYSDPSPAGLDSQSMTA